MNVPRSIVCVILALLAACDRPVGNQTPDRAALPAPQPASSWQSRAGSEVQVITPGHEAALNAAIARARATADDARRRWTNSPPGDRANWAVKWAAPTEDGRVEHVWVRPRSWTEFRIEGVLDSPPSSPLACGRAMGESVGFPVEELSDWIHAPTGDFHANREGGFTVEVLEHPDR